MNRKYLLLGITLFSMFFGAGNLIFAPYLGAQSGSAVWLALGGMLITSVVLPVCSICIIAPYQSASNMISRISKPLALIFMTLVYLLIGPCIAIPRTASTALEMWTWMLPQSWMNTAAVIVFFAVAFAMAIHPGKLKDILGKVMGPVLVLLILFVCVPLLFRSPLQVAPSSVYASSPFLTGLNEGYQTMDILAAFCFGILISTNIARMDIDKPQKALISSALIAGVLLACLYTLLALCSSLQSGSLQSFSNGAQILSNAAIMSWGGAGRILCGLIFLIACLNVCSGLLACCSEYFEETFGRLSYKGWLILFTIAGAVTACSGLDSILSWSGTLLSWICPVAIVILAIGLFMHLRSNNASMRKSNGSSR